MSTSKLDERKDEILTLLGAGHSESEVARRMGCARSTLQFYRRNHLHMQIGPPDELSSDVDDPTELPVYHLDYSSSEVHYVYPLGDIHKGGHAHQAQRWREWVRYLTDQPDRSLLNTGDNLNAAIIGSKSDIYTESGTVASNKRELRDELRDLASQGRLDCLADGNHEDRIYRATGDTPIRDVAEWLDVPYVQNAAMFVYHVGDIEYEMYFRHGTGNGQSAAMLKKSNQVAQADVYVTGHTHAQTVTADDIFVRDADRMVRRHRYYVSAGSFLGLEHYAAQRGYSPTRIGAPRIFLDGRRHDVHVSI